MWRLYLLLLVFGLIGVLIAFGVIFITAGWPAGEGLQ
jgi:hypothetical protein